MYTTLHYCTLHTTLLCTTPRYCVLHATLLYSIRYCILYATLLYTTRYTAIYYTLHHHIQGGANVITLLENATTFANGAKCQFGFDICEVTKRRIQIDKPSIGLLRKNVE